ncbi:MAG: site-2 protease family protein [Candidatus Pacearchaeota archaeon]
MDFSIYSIFDFSVLIIFLLALGFFLWKNKKNLKTEGALFLYKTSWGIKTIDYIGGKYKKTLKALSYVSVILGYILMAGILYLLINTVYSYIAKPEITEAIKAPPIAPLIPYFTTIFGLSDFLPPFGAIYFILAILVVATVHEFSHGIFAKRWGVGIKSTGFAFLKYFPAILGAFVEQDDKDMNEKPKFQQMSILSAGTFANVITSIFFFVILICIFSLAFSPIGIIFADYAYSPVAISNITSINNISLENPNYTNLTNAIKEIEKNKTIVITTHESTYIATRQMIDLQNNSAEFITLYEDAPAINAGLTGIISEINGVKIKSKEDFSSELSKYSPNEKIEVKTIIGGMEKMYEITLEENPHNNGSAYLGIVTYGSFSWFIEDIAHFISSTQTANLQVKGGVYYSERFRGVSSYAYYLAWWIVAINLMVALFNMLPLGGLDGGRFFELTIESITKSKKVAKQMVKLMNYILYMGLVILMAWWIFKVIL